jgi:putative transcriptional regulator
MSGPTVIDNLRDHLLVATRELDGSPFDHSVIYVCSHNKEGAMGVVINHPMPDVTFNEIMTSLDVLPKAGLTADPIIYAGGPVETNRGFVLHSNDYSHETTLAISPSTKLSASADIVRAIAEGTGPRKLNFCLGYAGWGPGQLENEIAGHSWLVLPADEGIVFNRPAEERYDLCMKRLSIDVSRLVGTAGRA